MERRERIPAVEFRAAGNKLIGTAIRYGRMARDRRERFAPGAFALDAMPTELNLQHDLDYVIADTERGNLRLTDSPDALRLEADLRPGSAEYRLLQRGSLRGLSVEFVATEERRIDGVREITGALLPAIALVDDGSYQSSVELRQRGGWLTSVIRSGTPLGCECVGPECMDAEYEWDGLGITTDQEWDLNEVLAVGGGGFANVLGSTSRGTLALAVNKKRELEISLTNPNTDAARKVMQSGAVAPIYARPIIDDELSEFEDVDGVRKYSRPHLRAILIKPSDKAGEQGWKPARIEGVETRARRRKRWL